MTASNTAQARSASAPIVSVVIPTHNRAGSLGAAIRSALGQTERAIEVLVVDDASTDDTEAVVTALKDPRVRYVRRSHNGGDAASRNTGIRESSAPYIAFLDDDDEWLPDKLSLQLAEFERDPETGLVHTAEYLLLDGLAAEPEPVTKDPAKHVRLSQLTTSSVMVRRQCIEAVGLFDETMPCASDWDLWIRLDRAYPVRYVNVPLIRYCASKAGLSGNIRKIIDGQGKVFAKNRAYFEEEPSSYSRYLVAFGFLCCYAGQMREGRAALRKAIRLQRTAWRAYVHYGFSLAGERGFRALEILPRRLGIPWGSEGWEQGI